MERNRFEEAAERVRAAADLAVDTDYQPMAGERIPVFYSVLRFPTANVWEPIVFLGGADRYAARRAQ